MSQADLGQTGLDILGAAEQAELHRQDLLRTENLSQHIRFDGNRPYLDPSYRKEIIKATLASTVLEVRTYGPWGTVRKNLKFLINFLPNMKRIPIHRRYRDLIVERKDKIDSMWLGISDQVDCERNPELWTMCVAERFETFRDDLDELWLEYRRKLCAAGWNSG